MASQQLYNRIRFGFGEGHYKAGIRDFQDSQAQSSLRRDRDWMAGGYARKFGAL